MGFLPWKSDFTAGEVSPLLRGRIDLTRYAKGAEVLENWVIHVQGGISRRAGTAHVAYTRGGRPAALVPFVFNQNQSYILEFTSQAIRFYFNREQIVGPDVSPAASLVLSATTGTVTATGPAVFDALTKKDIGRRIRTGDGGEAVIVDVLSTTQVTAIVVVDFGGVTYNQGGWWLTGLPIEVTTPYSESEIFELRWAQSNDVLYVCHPNHPVHKLIRLSQTEWSFLEVNFNPPPSLEAGDRPLLTLVLSGQTGTVTATASGSYFLAADVGRVISARGGAGVITALNAGNQVVLDVITTFPQTNFDEGEWRLEGSPIAQINTNVDAPKGAICTLTLDKAGFRTNDVGRFVHALGGLARIVSYVSVAEVKANILIPFQKKGSGAQDGDPAGAWTLEDAAWSDNFGYPAVPGFHEQRSVFASTKNNPLTVWMSQTADFENFAEGPEDDNAIRADITANQLNTIRWLKPMGDLMIGTVGGEHMLHGGELALTPSNRQVDDLGNNGAMYEIDPVRLNGVIILVDRSRRKVKELLLNETGLALVSVDLGVIAEHLFREPIKSLAVVQTPDTYILVVGEDGRMRCCAYNRAEEVVGWTRFTTDGKFTNVAVIPTDCGDEAWVVVERVVGGQTRHVVEFFEGSLTLDSAVFYEGALASSMRGLYHLEGRTVKVIGDGLRVEDKVVANGAVSLLPAQKIVVGRPFGLTAVTLPPEVQTARGSSQGRKKRIVDVVVRLLCTEALYVNPTSLSDTSNPQSLTVNGEDISLSGRSEKVEPGVPFTGDYLLEAHLGWDRKGQLTFLASQPIRATILGVGADIEVED